MTNSLITLIAKTSLVKCLPLLSSPVFQPIPSNYSKFRDFLCNIIIINNYLTELITIIIIFYAQYVLLISRIIQCL